MRHLIPILLSFCLFACSPSQHEKSEYQSALQAQLDENITTLETISHHTTFADYNRNFIKLMATQRTIQSRTDTCLNLIHTLQNQEQITTTEIQQLKQQLIQFKQHILQDMVAIFTKLYPSKNSYNWRESIEPMRFNLNFMLPTDTITEHTTWEDISFQQANVLKTNWKVLINQVWQAHLYVQNELLFDAARGLSSYYYSNWANILIEPRHQVINLGDTLNVRVFYELEPMYQDQLKVLETRVNGTLVALNVDNELEYTTIHQKTGTYNYTVQMLVEHPKTKHIDTIQRTFYYNVLNKK